MQVEASQSENIHSIIDLELRWEFQISPFRFGFSSKNESRHNSNHPNRRTSSDPLLVPNYHFGHSGCHGPNSAILCPDSWSPWKMSPDTSWTIQIRRGQIFKPPTFQKYFAFYSLIRTDTTTLLIDLLIFPMRCIRSYIKQPFLIRSYSGTCPFQQA